MKKIIFLTFSILSLIGCSKTEIEKKGFDIAHSQEMEENRGVDIKETPGHVTGFETKPSAVLLTSMPEHRLSTIYKVNRNKNKVPFIGTNDFLRNYDENGYTNGNQWNYHYMPGFEAVSGYNMVNVSHFDTKTLEQKNLFEKPVLIKTLYYPSPLKDTLNYQPIHRDYYILSVYDEDTNGDGRVDMKDLRRLYYFDKNAENKWLIVPENYSVLKSEYDFQNDYLYVFASLDENNNGQHEVEESVHIFWVDLKDPKRTGRLY